MDAKKFIATLFLALILVPSVFAAVKPVTWNFDNQQGADVNNVISQVYTCNDDECYVPTSYTPYIDTTSTGNTVTTNLNYGYSAIYFFADGYIPKEYIAWIADTNPLTIDNTMDKLDNCHAVVDNLNVPYEVENNKPVTINVPISAQTDVNSPFIMYDQAPYFLPVENDESDPLFDHLAADVNVKFELLDEDNDVVLTQTKDIKVFASTTKTISFSFTSPDEPQKYKIRIVTNVTDNQCASSSEDETTKDLIVVDEIPDCYTLINNLEVSEPYPIVNDEFDITAHIFGTVQDQSDDVDVELRVTKTSDGSLVYSDTTSFATDTATDVEFSWTPTEVADYDINMYTSIDNALCTAANFEDANILGFYVKPVPTYDLNFHISDVNQNVVNNASIDLENTNTAVHFTTATDAQGEATITGLYEDDYKFTVSADGYQDYVNPEFHLARDNDVYVVMNPTQPPQYTLTVDVVNGLDLSDVVGAAITLDGPTDATGTSDANGQAVFADLQEGSYNIEVTATGFEDHDSLVLVDSNKVHTVTLQDVNDAPVFNAVAQQNVEELSTLTFTISATDADELGALSYSSLSLPEGASFNSETQTFSFTPGLDTADPFTGYAMFEAEFKVQDTRGGSDTMTVDIRVNNNGRTMTASIDCLDEAVLDSKQVCTVTAIGDDSNALSGATVQFYDEGTYIGSNTTNAQGNVVFEYDVISPVGTHDVTANLVSLDYDAITVSSSYLALAHAYDIDYLRVYSDDSYSNEQYTFYRGENLYTKFSVVDVNDGSLIPEDVVVTKVELVSHDGGGRANLTLDKYEAGYYYFMLEPIPLTHDFIGTTGIYALAINYTDNSGGEGYTYITILNNPPTIGSMPDTFYVTEFDQEFDLSEYLDDVEGDVLDIDLAVSQDDSSVLFLEEDDETNIFTPVLSTDGKQIFFDHYARGSDFEVEDFDEDNLEFYLEDTEYTLSEGEGFIQVLDEDRLHFLNYLGKTDDFAVLCENPNVVVEVEDSTLIAHPKSEGQTTYILTVEDEDGEVVTQNITFVLDDFNPDVEIDLDYDGDDIVVDRTDVTFSLDIEEDNFLDHLSYSIEPIEDYSIWTILVEVGAKNIELFNSDEDEFTVIFSRISNDYVALYEAAYVGEDYGFVIDDYDTFAVLRRSRPDDGEEEETEKIELYIGDVALPGGLTYHPGDNIIIDLHFENSGDIDLENVKIVAAVPQLQISREAGPFDLNENKEMSKVLTMPIPEDSDLGEYTIVIDVLDNGELNRRVGRYIEVTEE